MIENVDHLGAVRCPHAGIQRTLRVGWYAIELVIVDGILMILGSQMRPSPHVPAKSQVAVKGCDGASCLGIGHARPWPDEPYQEAREVAIELLREIFDRDGAAGNEKLAFVRIRSDQKADWVL